MSEDNVIGAFSETDAAKLTGLTVGQLRAWNNKGFMKPSFIESDHRLPYGKIYSFRDIVSLRVLGQLRNKHKVSLQHLRQVSDSLAHLGDARWIATTLYVLGKRVVLTDPTDEQRKEIVTGQRVFDIPLRVVVENTRKAIADMNRRSEAQTGKVVHGKFTLQNEPVFEGTRIPVATIKRYLDAGFTAAAIIAEFPDITLQDIKVASSFENGKTAA